MSILITAMYWIGGFITLAEALNKLDRCTPPTAAGLAPRERLVQGLKAAAWALLAIGSAGVLAGGVLDIPLQMRELAHACVLGGFAMLIVRTRVKEG